MPSFVQSVSKTVAGVNNTTLAFGSDVTAGNWIGVTQSSWRSGGHTIQTPTDTRGHTYTAMHAELSSFDVRLRSYFVENINAGANTVTYDMDGTATGELSVTTSEFSDVKASASLNASNTNSGTATTAVSSGDVTPTVNGCLLYAATTNNSNNVALTEEGGWTLLEKRIQASTVTVATEWKIGTTSAEDADWTAASGMTWIAAVAAFESAAVTGAGSITEAADLLSSTGEVVGAAVIEKVQSVSKTIGGVNNTTLAFGSSLAAGNWIGVTQASWRTGGNVIQTPTDTRGHTYLSMAAQVGSSTNTALRSYYAANTTAGANTVTFDMDGTGTGEISCTVAEFTGVKRSSPQNGAGNTGTGSGTAVSSGNVTPTVNGCLLYAATTLTQNGVALTEEAGWTLLEKRIQAITITVATEWKIGTTSAEDADWTAASSVNWAAMIAAFEPAVSIIGVGAITEAADTVTGVGAVADAAAAAIQESADTLAATAQAAVTGAAAIQEAVETAGGHSSSGFAVSEITEAADLLAATGEAAIVGSADIQEALESVESTDFNVTGVATIQEAAEALAASGEAAIAASAALVEAQEAVSSAGTVSIDGQAAITEAVELIEAVGSVFSAGPVVGSASITELSDILVSAARLLTRGEGAVVEAPDVLGGQAAEAPDTMTGAAGTDVTGAAAVIEAPDTVTGVGSLESGGGVVEEAPDVLAGTGVVPVRGVGNIREASDIPTSTGLGVPKLSAARVSFTLNTATGLQVVPHPGNQNGTDFLGNFFLFASVGGAGNSAGITECFGAAVAVPVGGGAPQQWVTFASVLDGATVTDASDGGDDTKCIEFINTGAVTTEAAAFVSSAIGQFTINVTTAGAGRTMECLVLGGSSIEAQVGHYPNSPAGDLVINTELSDGKALLLAGGTDTEGGGRITSSTGHLSIGAARSPNNQWAITTRSAEDRTTGSLSAGGNDNSRCFGSLRFSLLEYRVSESLISLGPSSFTVRPQPAGGTGEVYYAFLGGPASYEVRTLTQPTTPQVQPITGFGFSPIASLFAGAGKVNDPVPSAEWRHSFGFALSGAEQAVIATTDTNAANPSESASARVVGRCMTVRSGGIPTNVADAAFESSDVDGISLNWITADSTPRMFGLLSIGPEAQVTVAQPNSLMLLGLGV